MTDRLSGLFEACLLDVLLPAVAVSRDDLASLTAEELTGRISGEQRTTAYYDEQLVCYVKLSVPVQAGVTAEQAKELVESDAFVSTVQLTYLQHTAKGTIVHHPQPRIHHGQPQLTRQSYGLTAIPQHAGQSPPNTPRLGAPSRHAPALPIKDGALPRTPGFPFTPVPVPARPTFEANEPFYDHATGPVIAEGSHDLEQSRSKWTTLAKDGTATAIWRIQCSPLAWQGQPHRSHPLAVTATVAFHAHRVPTLAGNNSTASDKYKSHNPEYLRPTTKSEDLLTALGAVNDRPLASDEPTQAPIKSQILRRSFRRVLLTGDAIHVHTCLYRATGGETSIASPSVLSISLASDADHSKDPSMHPHHSKVEISDVAVKVSGDDTAVVRSFNAIVQGQQVPVCELVSYALHDVLFEVIAGPADTALPAPQSGPAHHRNSVVQTSTSVSSGATIDIAVTVRVHLRHGEEQAYLPVTDQYTIAYSALLSALDPRPTRMKRKIDLSKHPTGSHQAQRMSISSVHSVVSRPLTDATTSAKVYGPGDILPSVQGGAGSKRYSAQRLSMSAVKRSGSTSGQARRTSAAGGMQWPPVKPSDRAAGQHARAPSGTPWTVHRPDKPQRSFTMPSPASPAPGDALPPMNRSRLSQIRTNSLLGHAVPKSPLQAPSATSYFGNPLSDMASTITVFEGRLKLMFRVVPLSVAHHPRPDADDEEHDEVSQKLADFRLSPAMPQLQDDKDKHVPAPARPASKQSASRQAKIEPLERFLLEIFVTNDSIMPASITFAAATRSKRKGGDGLVAIDAETSVQGLAASASQIVSLRYLALASGLLSIRDLMVRDVDANRQHVISKVVDVVVA